MTISKLKSFYIDHLFSVLVPFWVRKGIDKENGGFFTCFTNTGERLTSKNKYIWSQGRFLWMLGRLVWGFSDLMGARLTAQVRDAARAGARFLMSHALLPDGSSAWVLDEKGTPILTDRKGNMLQPKRGDRLDLGIAADHFLAYGMAEYARAFRDRRAYEWALRLYGSIVDREGKVEARRFPHDLPTGFKAHARPMGMLELSQEMADVAIHFRDPAAFRLAEAARLAMSETLSVFVRPEKQTLLEYVGMDGAPAWGDMLGSFCNPGHSLEDAWFLMHFAKRVGDEASLRKAVEVVRWMAEAHWDRAHGGLPQFAHVEGGEPHGAVDPRNKGDHMIEELRENWSNKLWWVHSEALYALILAYEHSRDSWFLDTYWKYHEYVFRTFPHPDPKVGEWIQIRNREGRPEDNVVALPVKDPYHIVRAVMHIVKSLERTGA